MLVVDLCGVDALHTRHVVDCDDRNAERLNLFDQLRIGVAHEEHTLRVLFADDLGQLGKPVYVDSMFSARDGPTRFFAFSPMASFGLS